MTSGGQLAQCDYIRPLLSFYYDGEATPDEAALVERHLATCADCRSTLAAYRAIGSELRALPVPVPPAGLRREVWRRIGAQATAARLLDGASRPDARVVEFPQAQPKRERVSLFGGVGGAWARAVPAALIAAVLLIFAVGLIIRGVNPETSVASLLETEPLADYSRPVHVQFGKQVVGADAARHTTVWRVDAAQGVEVATDDRYDSARRLLTIAPEQPWSPGATYEVQVDAPNISLGIGREVLGSSPIKMTFNTVANTPTPTRTPTLAPTSTPTTVPTDTPEPEPTAIAATPVRTVVGGPAQSPVAPTATEDRPKPTNTAVAATTTRTPAPRPSATSTHAPTATTEATATGTPEPARTATATATATATREPGATATSTGTPRKGTPTGTATPRATATPRITTTPTPVPPCSIMPERGFGKLWAENAQVRARLECPVAPEQALSEAAHQRFEAGYMFWRGDTRTIYVFVGGGPKDTTGLWHEYRDSWQEGEALPQVPPAPPGLYLPERGFGKLWRTHPELQQQLGYALAPEAAITGAWQPFKGGSALWTSDKVIRVMYSRDGLWQRFEDTFEE